LYGFYLSGYVKIKISKFDLAFPNPVFAYAVELAAEKVSTYGATSNLLLLTGNRGLVMLFFEHRGRY
jgi:hypothetical protein